MYRVGLCPQRGCSVYRVGLCPQTGCSVFRVGLCPQRELKQSELVLELMMAPLVCTFLACLMQLTTLCAAWNFISDRQRRRPRHQTSQQLSTPV